MGNELLTILMSAIGLIVTALVTWATQKLIQYLNSKIDNNETIKFLQYMEEVINTVVKSTCQTYVNALKANNEWTKETQMMALNIALTNAKTLLSQEAKDYIEKNHGSIDQWLTSQIEACVYNLKAK